MERGFKGLNVELTSEGTPQLVSPSQRHVWSEDLEQLASRFDKKEHWGAGFYSLKTPEEVSTQGYYHPKKFPSVLVEIAPHGQVVHGEKGYRSEKASLTAIYKEDYLCDACNKEPCEVMVHRGKEEVPLCLCKSCLRKAKKVLPKKVKLQEMGIENFWYTLGKRYGVDLRER